MKVEDKVKKYLEKIKAEDGKINCFLHINSEIVKEAQELDKKKGKKGKLYGMVFGNKSNINVKGMICNCASKTLENYRAGYDSTVIQRIKEEDGLIIGMTNCDEFASGSSGENSAFGATQNPSAKGRITGGSSSGSAAAVAAGFCDVAFGSDTGGSIRNPASHCGVVGVKPSYGMVSRYGLIDLSMSLDQIGPLGKTVKDCARVLDVISGRDERDTTTIESNGIKFEKLGKLKVGIIRVSGVDKRIQDIVDMKVDEIKKKLRWDVKEVEVKYIDLAVQTYYPLVYVELYSATRRFDGRKYGKKIEDNCGEEVLRRILGGSEITRAEFHGAYYEKALKVKELIRSEFERVFIEVDCLMLPTVPVLPWKIGEGKKMKLEDVYAADALTSPVNLAGVCGVSIPVGLVKENDLDIPVGMQVVCGKGEDGKMMNIAREIEKISR
jgi:aspartyl-tRNA(Asn)/glutamyl-tRNA(Gln) amidotransferase subunit A